MARQAGGARDRRSGSQPRRHRYRRIGSADKEAIVRDRGAAEVVNYRTENLRERVKALTSGRGVDVFFDNVGGEVFTTMTRAMNWGGRMLPIGFASGEIPAVPVNLLLLKNCSVVGAFYGAWSQRFPAESSVADGQLFAGVGAGRLRPHVCEAVPLEDCRRAFELATSRRAQGRVVLLVRRLDEERTATRQSSPPNARPLATR